MMLDLEMKWFIVRDIFISFYIVLFRKNNLHCGVGVISITSILICPFFSTYICKGAPLSVFNC